MKHEFYIARNIYLQQQVILVRCTPAYILRGRTTILHGHVYLGSEDI